jgi:pimeloyl-ACP methyl ester carboxylesterase
MPRMARAVSDHADASWQWGILLVLLAAVGGCASQEYVTVRRTPQNPLAGSLQLLSRTGPKPTPRTEQLLRQYDLQEYQSDELLERLQAEIAQEPLPEKLYSFAELAYLQAKKAEALRNEDRALDLYGATVAHAYWYLFDPTFDRFRNPYDPQFRGACDLYNEALEGAMRIVHRQGQLKPGSTYTIETDSHEYRIDVVSRGKWQAADFERLEFVSDFEVNGLRNRHHTFGLGVPLVAVRRQRDPNQPAEAFYPPGLSFATTAFLRVHSSPQGAERVRHCVLELHDPLVSKDIQVADRLVPLETDLTTPLAYFLNNPEFDQRGTIATVALLMPGQARAAQGFYMVEPYDPQKIPVIMVHGLWSSPVTWMEMFNDLRSFPEIRNQYQFWFYFYPTGQPFWVSASQMREQLAEMKQKLDPQKETPTLDQIVLVGHSMGGLVSKLQTVYSGDDFWRLLSDQPFEALKAEEEIRERVAQVVYFEPNPSVRRVVTIGTPHRGSDFANKYTRWLGRHVISLPEKMVSSARRLTHENPGFFRDDDLLTISTSIDSLAPDSPALPTLLNAQKYPWTTHHNIVGLAFEEGLIRRLAGDGDGIVEYESAHLDDVASEITVPADHMSVHRHPRSILEIRRILMEHQTQVVAEMGRRPETIPAGYQPSPTLQTAP